VIFVFGGFGDVKGKTTKTATGSRFVQASIR